jgi:hypothetical protein
MQRFMQAGEIPDVMPPLQRLERHHDAQSWAEAERLPAGNAKQTRTDIAVNRPISPS